ncbi:MAG TPA: aspartyl protease family protein [Caulobacteraceae bacterium]|nr:aspartyl protease family protein [Caulobacteraceae bacterium]
MALLALCLAGLAGPALAECKLEKIADLPVTMRGLSPLVTADVDGVKVDFTVDSGSFFSLLSPAVAAKLGRKPGPLPPGMRVVGVNGRADGIGVVTVKVLDLGGVGGHDVEFLVGAGEMFPGAGGLLGQNVLRAADIEYDLANGMIRLWRSQGCSNAALAYWDPQGATVLRLDPTTSAAPHMQGMVTVNGVRLRAIFDTGAPLSSLSLKSAARAGVTPQSPQAQAGPEVGGIGVGRKPSWIAPFASFEIGGELVKNTRLLFADVDLRDAGMLIGADFFLSHRVYASKAERQLYFTYNGGPVFSLGAAPAPTPVAAATPAAPGRIVAGPEIASPNTPEGMREPTDAAGFSRRGSAYFARRDFPHAIADFTRAAELEPANAKHFYFRGQARLVSGQPVLGLADLNETLRLKPDDSDSLLMRAELYLRQGDEDRARRDFDSAIRAAPADSTPLMRRAAVYANTERFEPALGYYDQWIAQNPKDMRLHVALNGSCFMRAVLGRDLEGALADCDAALKLQPGGSGYLDSRALVHLRLGHVDEAIADYDAALKAQPKRAFTLYARSVARQRKGDQAGADADRAAAIAIDPKVADIAKRYGLES